MCSGSACGVFAHSIFFEKDTTAKDLKCPCGYDYWEIFQECFVPKIFWRFTNDGRAQPEEAREMEIKEQKSISFEARMRVQFILHCISCGIKRRQDEGQTDAGFDEQSLLRAAAEILEIANGDYESRGGSATLQTVQTIPVPYDSMESSPSSLVDTSLLQLQIPLRQLLSSSSLLQPNPATNAARGQIFAREQTHDDAPQASSQKSSATPNTSRAEAGEGGVKETPPLTHRDQAASHNPDPVYFTDVARQVQEESHDKEMSPTISEVNESDKPEDGLKRFPTSWEQEPHSQTRIRDYSEKEVLSKESLTRSTDSKNSTSKEEHRPTQSMFLPGEGISLKVLESYKENETFGKWTSINRTQRNGREGFLIGLAQGTKPLDAGQIKVIKQSTIKSDATKKPPRKR